MRCRNSTIFIFVAAFVVFSGLSYAAIQYEVIDLGRPSGSYCSRAMAINNQNQIIGDAMDYINVLAVSFCEAGSPLILSDEYSQAFALNDNGVIAGHIDHYAAVLDAGGQGQHSIIGPEHSHLFAVNNSSQAVGHIAGQATLFNLQDPAGFLPLGYISSFKYTCAISINHTGMIVGYSTNSDEFYYPGIDSCPVLFDPSGNGYNTHLGSASTKGAALDINNAGIIAGEVRLPGQLDVYHAAVYDASNPESLLDLGCIVNGIQYDVSIANAINARGQIVGDADGPAGWIAVLFDPSGQGNNMNLNTLIDPGSGWRLHRAWDINDYGWIVGEGDINGASHAFLLTPVPEPGGLMLMLLGIGVVSRSKRS